MVRTHVLYMGCMSAVNGRHGAHDVLLGCRSVTKNPPGLKEARAACDIIFRKMFVWNST